MRRPSRRRCPETGLPELAGLPSNVVGLRARRSSSSGTCTRRTCSLGYHISVWGTGVDIALSNPSDATVDVLAGRAAAFYNVARRQLRHRLRGIQRSRFGFYQYVYGDSGHSWWDAETSAGTSDSSSGFSAATAKRIVMWQIPLGNTRMRAQNNTNGHYQDNRPEWLLDEPGRTHLTAYRDAGVVAFLFGGGAGGPRAPATPINDGVTNPAPINGNTLASEAAPAGTAPGQVMRGSTPTLVTPYAADDDGGFFRWKAWQYLPDGTGDLLAARPPISADQLSHSALNA